MSFACPDQCGIGEVRSGKGSGKGDRPPNGNKNVMGGGDLHRSALFRPPKPERADPDKIQKPSDMVCSRFPGTILSWDFSGLAFQPGLL